MWLVEYELPPLYDDSCVSFAENNFGIIREPLPKRIHFNRVFDIQKFKENGGAYRVKNRVISGERSSVYAIINPLDGLVFYIGSTRRNITTRLWHHIIYGSNSKVREIMRKIHNAKQNPLIVELCKCPTEFQFDEERRWILGAKRIYKLANCKLN